MAFHDIPGNGRIKTVLGLALRRGRVPNSILFAGPKGAGKKATARVLAKALNCLQRTDDACDVCDHCRAIDEERFPDVLDIEPDRKVEASESDDESALEPEETNGVPLRRGLVKITQARLMKRLAYLKPMAGRHKVFIVDEAETMKLETWSTLLKILEEPPLFTHFFLISERPELLLPTIRSRCRTLSFLPVPTEEVERVLRERDVPEDRARVMAQLARGDLDLALDMDWDEVQAERRDAWDLFRVLIAGENPAPFLRRFSYLRRKDVDEFARMLEPFSTFCRDLVLVKEGGESRLLFNPDYEADLRASAPGIDLERALACARLIDEARADIDRKANVGLQASYLMSQMVG